MKILYIHGLDSEPNPAKLSLIANQGHQPFALHLDYRKDKQAYQKLEALVRKEKIEFIIGSSLGGYFGYWLGLHLGISQLLFNPAMPFRSVQVPVPNDMREREGVHSWVVLGQRDEVIPPNLNRSFFEGREQAKVITCNWLGHRIDEQTFSDMLRWAKL